MQLQSFFCVLATLGWLGLMIRALLWLAGPTTVAHPLPAARGDPTEVEDLTGLIRDLTRAGNRIGALYLEQQQSGTGFHQARAAVEALSPSGDDSAA